jgi:hypothetical protein
MVELRDIFLTASRPSLSFNSPLLHVFAGHDTVIAPVLSALGVYHSPQCEFPSFGVRCLIKLDCVWPHYASRLLLELWINERNELRGMKKEHYIRLVYNGEDVTSFVPTCANHIVRDQTSSLSPSFCPLTLFIQQIDEILSPYQTRKKACLGK